MNGYFTKSMTAVGCTGQLRGEWSGGSRAAVAKALNRSAGGRYKVNVGGILLRKGLVW